MQNISVIRRFEISGLFGLHDYRLEFGKSGTGESLHQSLLYGDNGTGKTTILKLMYNLLSRMPDQGSRTYLSKTPFKRIFLELTEGQSIELIKDQEQRLSFFDGRSTTTIALVPDAEGAIIGSNNPDIVVFEKFLADLRIEQLYLSDDRKIMTSYSRFDRRRQTETETYLLHIEPRWMVDRDTPALNSIDLNALGKRVHDIIRDKLFESSVYGQSNVNNIYLDLARRLSTF